MPVCLPWWIFRPGGAAEDDDADMYQAEDAGDLAHHKVVLTTGLHTVVVRGHAVEEVRVNNSSSEDTPVAVVHLARITATGLFLVTLIAAVSIARGLGTPGVLARDVACRDKPER